MELTVTDLILRRIDIFLLLFMRMLGLFTTAPIWSNRLVPVQLRVAISFGTAVVVSPLFRDLAMPDSFATLGTMVVRELLVGMVIGFVAALVLSAVQLAGQLLDINMGLSMVNLLDPMTNTQMPVVGNFMYILALLIFFTINGHHMLLQALMDSYALAPIGKAVLTPALAESVVKMGANLFLIGFKVAAPVLAALFLTTVALGILNRAVPQMNVFVVGMPVQLGVGIFMLMVALPLFLSFLHVLFRGMSVDIMTLLRLLKG
ncbi:MAG TPA: flagellar biosynthetic protein FliR [Symbiobacteriaceae bacterium]|nr:flagellar biosynthetic protein FliR [Symbiobacteriaceae bacterium]